MLLGINLILISDSNMLPVTAFIQSTAYKPLYLQQWYPSQSYAVSPGWPNGGSFAHKSCLSWTRNPLSLSETKEAVNIAQALPLTNTDSIVYSP
jgi:hypothetical protein